ncbi:nad dependent epimerase [Colletotrichum truncatum]|uniref:Nad dependent epimerase n=1 Tax=Colletotrichum truncatum TaxID=5467 RepID=A0ACC3ZBY9_COLTU|nr:nad dependent epimerase [Colletotrichum truncatum]KAF6783855.1 nad dependent epimerase [Colletotrichum truncatum]
MSNRVLLTGANGFIAQHILAQLLEAGHSVRAIVRTQPSVDQLRSTFSSYPPSKLDYALVPDICVPGAFDTVLVSDPPFDLILHTASPYNFRQGKSNLDFLDPAIKGTTEILHGVLRKAPEVKRVVITSSTAAVVDISIPRITETPKIYNENDWCKVSREEAETTDQRLLPYVASKTFAEKAAWQFLAEKQPSFDIVTINPPLVYGPFYDSSVFKSPQEVNQSNFNLYNYFLNPELTSESPVPPEGLHLYVDVRDAARAHLLAATTPEAGGNRFLVSPGGISHQRIVNILREVLPQLQGRIPKGDPEKTDLPEGIFGVDSSLARRVLGVEYTREEDTFKDLARQLFEIEQRAQTA